MNQSQFRDYCAAGPILLDGATGTHLQQAGMPTGTSPEMWVIDHPDVLADLQSSYLQAGCSILYAFTFGANRIKLAGHGIGADPCTALNIQLARISLDVRDRWMAGANAPDSASAWHNWTSGRPVLVAGDLAPTGQFLMPAGDLTFEELVDIYYEQALGLFQAGVDLFVIETMIDLAQTRAAVLAIQSVCDLPIMASLTFEENGRTLTGNPPLPSLLALASLGVAAFGINCSFGPDKLAELLTPLQKISPVPLLVKPNAGMPHLINGKTVFPMDANAFAAAMKPMLAAGISLLGGCCGTGPDHIAAIARLAAAAVAPKASGSNPAASAANLASADGGLACADCLPWSRMIGSSRQVWIVDTDSRLPVLICKQPADLEQLADLVDDQPDAVIIDLTGCASQNLDNLFLVTFNEMQSMLAAPLIFRDHSLPRLKNLLRAYHGRAGLQIVSDADQVILSDLQSYFYPYDPVFILDQESLSCSS